MIAALTLSFASSVFAKGGDYISPFPKVDSLSKRQEAKAMAVDSSGNIIVVGFHNHSSMNNNYHATKFTAYGSAATNVVKSVKGGGSGDDRATAVVVDSNDNVIVTGTVWNGSNFDIHTVKYNSGGTLLWDQTFNGAANNNDIATSIAVDGANNIYIAGYSTNTSGNDDFLVLKYPADGAALVWSEVYDSSYHNNDRIMALTVGSNSFAVTGTSSKAGMDFDILTRKYDLDKNLIWEQRKASASNGDDRGVAIRMDGDDNVLMTGYLFNGTDSDIYTAKYAAASPGAVIWEKVYNGGNNDEPMALRVDGTGDVYMTGYTFTYGGNEDFYTVRYNSTDGTIVWAAIYNSSADYTDIPVDMIVKSGNDGGVFIVGYTVTTSNENITTLKYRKDNGTLLWQQSYTGTVNKNSRPVGINLGPTGDVCIAGWTDTATNLFDFVAIRYDYGAVNRPTDLIATATSNTTITLNWSDNATNESGYKIERKKGEATSYSQIDTVGAGVTTYNDNNPAAPLDTNSYYYYRVRAYNATDGNSYYSNEAHALTKVISYDTPVWTYQYNGADNREDEAVGIVVGSDEHPVVTGHSDLTEEGVEAAYSFDYMTIKLDRATSAVKWKARYDSGDGGTDMAAGLVLDNNGDAVVTGTAYLSGGSDKSDDLYTITYSSATHTDPNSNPPMAWGEQYGTQAGIDQATAIQAAKDAANNIVVIGHGINTSNDEDMFIIKYLANGSQAWPPIVYDGGTGGNDYPSAVGLDSSGNIFITGSTENAAGNFDIYTAKYSGSSGALLWSDTYAGDGNGDDHGLSLAIDKTGNVYITGHAVNADGNDEWVTIKYDGANVSSNRRLWKKVHNGFDAPVNGNDRAVAVAVDPIDGGVIVAGNSYRTLTDSDFHLIKYKADYGSIIWEQNFARPATYDYVTAMAVDASGYIYLTGNSRGGPDTDPDFNGTSDVLSLIYSFEGTFHSAIV